MYRSSSKRRPEEKHPFSHERLMAVRSARGFAESFENVMNSKPSEP